MYKLLHVSRRKNVFTYMYIATLLVAFHYYLITYINSSFLETFTTKTVVGLAYTFSAAISAYILLNVRSILERNGTYRLMLGAIAIEGASLVVMASSGSPVVVIGAFCVHHAINSLLLLCLDNFLESSSRDSETGHVRGIFLTLISTMAVVSPIIVGNIVTETDFTAAYILSALCLIPLFVIVRKRFKNLKDDIRGNIHHTSLKEFLENTSLRHVYITSSLLHILYSWLIIYIPLHLHSIGFSWVHIGLIISISLIPFVLFEIPVGEIADKRYGEKEIMAIGFIIAIGALVAISTTSTPHFLLWAGLLLLVRSGASLIEITTESYFFKQINRNNHGFISIFRTTLPIGSIVGPLLGSLSFALLPGSGAFLVLASLLSVGVYTSLKMKDTL